ncbi:MAG: ABC transporter ATP-binding protein [Rhodospirillales bacterium]|nr:ABC transporter ATP-binding protein [Rhodospirillales bacterium]
MYGLAQARQQVGALLRKVIESLSLRPAILNLGLEFQVGIGGSRLSVDQRQKVAMARCLLKRPDILMVNDATAALEPAVADRILDNIVKDFKGRGLIWVLSRAGLARKFDKVVIMDGGKVVEQGTYADMDKPDSRLAKLMATE